MVKNSPLCKKIEKKLEEIISNTISSEFRCSAHFDVLLLDELRKKHKDQSFVERPYGIKNENENSSRKTNLEGLLKNGVLEVMDSCDQITGADVKVKICLYDKDYKLQDYFEFKMRHNMKNGAHKVILKRKNF